MLRLTTEARAAALSEPHSLPYGRHFVDEADIEAVVRVLRSDYLTTGPVVETFEAALRRATGASDAVACANGTAALHLAARALGLGPGDTVIVPSITFVATANAARLVGAEVVFADVDPETGLMGPQELSAAIAGLPETGRRALFNVHLAGQPADLEAIAALARANGLTILDDAAHALGTEFRLADGSWRKIGGSPFADITTFSFHAVKTIAMGEGGAITLSNAELADRLRRDRSHGLSRDPKTFRTDFSRDAAGGANPWVYELDAPGLNYRASDIACALGLSQLSKLSWFASERRRLVTLYDRLLEPLFPRVRPLGRTPGTMPAWHLYVALFDFARIGLTRRELMMRLKAQGVGTQVHYIPVHRQPYYSARYGTADLPGANAYYEACLSLPLFIGMMDEDAERVVEAISRSMAA